MKYCVVTRYVLKTLRQNKDRWIDGTLEGTIIKQKTLIDWNTKHKAAKSLDGLNF